MVKAKAETRSIPNAQEFLVALLFLLGDRVDTFFYARRLMHGLVDQQPAGLWQWHVRDPRRLVSGRHYSKDLPQTCVVEFEPSSGIASGCLVEV